jgi:hypothetical protein
VTDPLTVPEILRAGVLRSTGDEETAAAQSVWDTDGGASGQSRTDGDVVTTGYWFSSDV